MSVGEMSVGQMVQTSGESDKNSRYNKLSKIREAELEVAGKVTICMYALKYKQFIDNSELQLSELLAPPADST